MKMCPCGECVYWVRTRYDALYGDCRVNPPVLNSRDQAQFPLTDQGTSCAEGWDGKPSEEQKMARAYMEGQMLVAKKGMDS